ncbi:hypothetical protein K8R42_04010 [bacterium]|nr:hypothetical protein [bacterium]
MHKILITSALLLVFGTSAYMSIYGLTAVFAGAGIVVVLMGAGMELGKLLTVIHLHRQWSGMRFYMRGFYMLVITALVMITSFEILGYLSQSHVQGTRDITLSRTALTALEHEEQLLTGSIETIDITLAGLPETYVTKRIKERQAAGYDQMQTRLVEIAKERSDLKKQCITNRAYAAPIFAAAGIFSIDATRAASIFILILVMVLEPLSIGLAIATSAVWHKGFKAKELTKNQENCLGQKNDGQKHEYMETTSTVGQKCSEHSENAAIAVLDNFDLGKNNNKINPRIVQNSSGIAQEIAQESKIDRVLSALVKRHNLTPEVIAKITRRKNIQTVKRWMSGNSPIPEKALRTLRVFLKNNNIRLVKSDT